MKKLLVLGSEGFIGSHVVLYGLKHSYDVHGIDLIDRQSAGYAFSKISLLSPEFDSFLAAHQFDIVMNCAGSGNVPFSLQMPISDFELNCYSVLSVLDSIRKHAISCKFIQLSSAAVYGNPATLPVSESAVINPVSPYGYHKWMAEIVCHEYATLYGLNIDILRPFSVYGPGLRKQLLWDVYQKAKHEEEIILWGNGEETRDFIYIDDLVRALFVIANNKSKAIEIYNVGSGESITIHQMVLLLFQKLGLGKSFSFNGKIRKGDPRFWQADINKLVNLGFRPMLSLEEGLTKTAEWLNANGS